jgi:hypothetical protein
MNEISIFELANNTYLRIDSPKTIVRKGEIVETYIPEFIKLNKSANDSWKKTNRYNGLK